MRYALVGEWQSHRAEPKSVRELYQFKGKTQAVPFSFLFLQRFLEASLIGLYIILVETFSKTRTVQWYQQFRMIAVAMQTFPVIFYDQFPVAIFNDIFLTGYF